MVNIIISGSSCSSILFLPPVQVLELYLVYLEVSRLVFLQEKPSAATMKNLSHGARSITEHMKLLFVFVIVFL